MTMITIVRSICKSPIITWFPSIKPGTGQFHIICPMEKYINTSKNTSDTTRRFLSFFTSLSVVSSPVVFFLSSGFSTTP